MTYLVSGHCSSTPTWIKGMVMWGTSWMVKERCPSSPSMRTLGTSMPPRGWTGNSKHFTPWELRLKTETPTCWWNQSPSLSSKSKTLMTTNPNSWMDHTQPRWLKGLLQVGQAQDWSDSGHHPNLLSDLNTKYFQLGQNETKNIMKTLSLEWKTEICFQNKHRQNVLRFFSDTKVPVLDHYHTVKFQCRYRVLTLFFHPTSEEIHKKKQAENNSMFHRRLLISRENHSLNRLLLWKSYWIMGGWEWTNSVIVKIRAVTWVTFLKNLFWNMKVLCLYRYVSSDGGGNRCGWSNIWKLCQTGLQHPAGSSVLLCGTKDRWEHTWILQDPVLH